MERLCLSLNRKRAAPKGIQVDHYSFDKYEDAHEAALELADRCRCLEMLGLPVSTAHQAWWYDELVSAVTSN